MTYADLIRAYAADVPFLPAYEAGREARLALGCAAGLSRTALSVAMAEPAPDRVVRRMAQIRARRAAREPLAYILGYAPFRDRRFRVTPDVLIPRADTEILVDLALDQPFGTLLDLGTGSGAIAITLLAERPRARGLATDLSEAALAIARDNAARLGVADRLAFQQADWFAAVSIRADLIVSNPPYVAAAAYDALAPEIRAHEPASALTPGPRGLEAIAQIAAGALRHLTPGGRLLVEIGHDQGPAAAALFRGAGLETVAVHSDFNGYARVVSGSAPS